MRKKILAGILSVICMITLFSIHSKEVCAASNGYGRKINHNDLKNSIAGAWIWDRDSDSGSHKRPPVIYYFYKDGTFEVLDWTGEDGYEEFDHDSPRIVGPDSHHTNHWTADEEKISTYNYYDGNLNMQFDFYIDDHYDKNGHTIINTYHQDGDPCQLIAISKDAYNDFKHYIALDWQYFNYKTLTIKPPSTTITKIIGGKRSFTVKWKNKPRISGSQIQYGQKKSFKKAKTLTIKKACIIKKKIKKLKSKKKYYVRVRTYKAVNGKKYYSSWSKKKTIRTK